MALLADRDPKQAQAYTRAANQKIISDSGMMKVIGPIQPMIKNVAPKERGAEGATKSRRKSLKLLMKKPNGALYGSRTRLARMKIWSPNR